MKADVRYLPPLPEAAAACVAVVVVVVVARAVDSKMEEGEKMRGEREGGGSGYCGRGRRRRNLVGRPQSRPRRVVLLGDSHFSLG